jgi:glycine/sarcosine N-methyltransferase
LGELYHALADYYDEVFPLNRGALDFVLSFLKGRAGDVHILDIGSAVGRFPLVLAGVSSHFHVTAIEPDEKMVSIAKRRSMQAEGGDRVRIIKASMEAVGDLFPAESFDVVLCLGNTLVHLQTPDEICRFISNVFLKLRRGGIFIIQVVNYSRILAQKITELPFIDMPNVSFARRYEFTGEGEECRVRFFTRLTVKGKDGDEDKVIDNETVLYPLEFDRIRSMMEEAGFEPIDAYGSYNLDPWNLSSPALILTGRPAMN